jgi:hypothetical protein
MQRRRSRDYDQAAVLLEARYNKLAADDRLRFFDHLQQLFLQEPHHPLRNGRNISAHGAIIKSFARFGPAERLGPMVFSLLRWNDHQDLEWWASAIYPVVRASIGDYINRFPSEALEWITGECGKYVTEERTGLLSDWFPETFIHAAAGLQDIVRESQDEQFARGLLRSAVPLKADLPEDKWHVFLCHASEDKDSFVRPLAEELVKRNLKVWFDEFEIMLGDGLMQMIDDGLAKSHFGVVVLSHDFFRKNWPRRELDALASREDTGEKVILPIWHGLDKKDVAKYSPLLAGRYAAISKQGVPPIVDKIVAALRKAGHLA